jgi:hypothetical protein
LRLIRAASRRELTEGERATLRNAADALVLASAADEHTRSALARAHAVLMSGRLDPWPRAEWLEQLADDLERCAPDRARPWTPAR